MIYAISLCHMEPAIIAASLMQMKRTCGIYEDWYQHWLVDHHWPVDPKTWRNCLDSISRMLGTECWPIVPYKNLGGTEGMNWAIGHIKPGPADYILWYDPDSWPVTPNWLPAMINVMNSDPTIATLSLWAPHEMSGQTDWTEETIAGHKVRFFPTHSEAFSVTMWRASFALPRINAEFEYYGAIETCAYRKAIESGMRCAWLADFKEIACPIPHPKVYTDWKEAHCNRTFLGNFDEYYKLYGDKS